MHGIRRQLRGKRQEAERALLAADGRGGGGGGQDAPLAPLAEALLSQLEASWSWLTGTDQSRGAGETGRRGDGETL